MANKRIIRVIIYEGDEELVNKYEQNSLNTTQYSKGHPKFWQQGEQVIGKEIFITGVTLDGEIGLFQAINKHNIGVAAKKEIKLETKSLEEPILNQLNE